MTKVDFYVLADDNPQTLFSFSCRLVQKVFGLGHRILIRLPDAQQAQQLDDLLWTFRDRSFLPHIQDSDQEYLDHPNDFPIVLSHGSGAQTYEAELLVNLTDNIPEHVSSFPRVAEIILQTDKPTEAKPGKLKHYRDRGFPVDIHDIQ